MPLLETLVITIGVAVTKGLLKVWLKDQPVAESVGSSVLDLVKSKTSDIMAARKGARSFEAIGDRVASSLVPVFESYDLRTSSREAVATEVATAISAANISAKLLAKFSYRPSKLLAHIKQKHPHGDQHFSDVESALYNRTLDLVAQYIIDLASTLPDYTAENFTEILQRFDSFMVKFEKVLDELDKLRATSESANKERAYADFEGDYRASLARKLDRVELLGIDVSRRVKRYQLAVSYTSLCVTSLGHNTQNGDEDSRLSVEDALAQSDRSAIIGEAGSGKTTLLQWIAVKAATDTFDKEMIKWRGSVPFFIELRRFLDGPPPPERFLDKTMPEIAGRMPPQWIHDLLRRGRALLLIDGLDEVAPDKRRDVLNWLEGLADSFKKVRIVITSRPPAYEEGHLEHLGFQDFHLVPMQAREIEMFIEHWHEAVLKEQGLETDEQVNVIIKRLLFKLKNSMPLMRLATNPLLCAMICALHYDRHMQLPADRNELYEACCSMLLERRDVEREIQIAQYPQLTYKQKRVLLDDLAYWMMKNGYSTVEKTRALQRMNLRLSNMQIGASDTDSTRILSLLVERSGIIKQATYDTIDFIHRTFQEYMAACAVNLEGDWGLLVECADNYQWQETIVLAAGFANKTQADELINKLLSREEEHPSKQLEYDLLAISCLETAVETSADIRRKVEDRLNSLIPPKRNDQWKSLAAAGDLAVSHLAHKGTYSDDEAAACVQVLGMIGSRSALAEMTTYVTDKRKKVGEAIENVLRSFTPEAISESGLSEALLKSLDKYVEEQHFRLSGAMIHALSGMQVSDWRNALPVTIRHLELVDCGPSDLFVVTVFPELKSLAISGDLAYNLAVLSGLEQLNLLDLRNESANWPSFRDVRLRSLQSLRLISDTDQWPDFSELSNFHSLTRLSLFTDLGADFPNLDEIIGLEKLEYLHLATLSGGWPDLEPLAQLPRLCELELSIATITRPGFFGLAELKLRKLKINLGPVNDSKVSHLSSRLQTVLPKCEIMVQAGWSKRKW